MKNLLVSVLAFVSGFVIMSLELLGGRLLAPYFGSSIYVWGSVITVFMLALSVGYLTGGKLSLFNPSLKRFSLIFFAAAATLYPLAMITGPVMERVFEAITDPRWGSFVAALFLFAPPTFILGLISPYAVRLLVINVDRAGNTAGTLYFLSTIGSALGTLATSFYFVLWFQMDTIIFLLSGTLLILGLVSWIAARFG
ncbi:MAG: fused MFS/spermidine synthase [Pseudomonadales bacterium]